MKLNKCILSLAIFCTALFTSCGDDKGEPTVKDITGTWVLTHYSYQYHYLQNGVWWDDKKDETVSSYEISDIAGEILGKWWDYLSFDNKQVTIGLKQYHLPTQPQISEFDLNNPDGHIAYLEACEKWMSDIGCQSGDFPLVCPFFINGSKLYIGTLYQGNISFISLDCFSLTYIDENFATKGEFKKYVYTFERNS